MHDEIRTVGVGQEDGFENLLVGDCRYGMALAGADAPVCGGEGRGAAAFGGVGALGSSGVAFEYVALFVVGGDDGLEFGEVDFQGGDAAPAELVGRVN